MKTYAPYFTSFFTSLLLLTSTTVLAAPAPVPAADPLIEYHTLPAAATSDNSSLDNKMSARIRALVLGSLDGRTATTTPAAAAAAAVSFSEDNEDENDVEDGEEDDWENWHSQWKRQQQERRCNLWNVCVRVYRAGE